MSRKKTASYYDAGLRRAGTPDSEYTCDDCGHRLALYRVLFRNGTIHFGARCPCRHRLWPQTATAQRLWADAPTFPSKRSERLPASGRPRRDRDGERLQHLQGECRTLDAQFTHAISSDQ